MIGKWFRSACRKIMLDVAALRWPHGRPRIVHVRLQDFELVVLANENVGRSIAALRRYETKDSRFLASQIRESDICIDIGANCGYYTVLMASRAINGIVHAFDPLPLYWHLLSINTLLNGNANVVANMMAVGSEIGTQDFSEAEDGAYSSFLPTERKRELRRHRVQVETLDQYVANREVSRVDILKVDVEGAEMMVIDGAYELLNSVEKRPRLALIELYEDNLKPYGISIPDVVSSMERFGYSPFIVGEQNKLVQFTSVHYNRFENVFFLDKSQHPNLV